MGARESMLTKILIPIAIYSTNEVIVLADDVLGEVANVLDEGADVLDEAADVLDEGADVLDKVADVLDVGADVLDEVTYILDGVALGSKLACYVLRHHAFTQCNHDSRGIHK